MKSSGRVPECRGLGPKEKRKPHLDGWKGLSRHSDFLSKSFQISRPTHHSPRLTTDGEPVLTSWCFIHMHSDCIVYCTAGLASSTTSS